MTTTNQIHVRRLPTGWWTAVQYQGSAQLPVTVASMSKDRNRVIESIQARQRAGWISPDAQIMVCYESMADSLDDIFGGTR